MFFHYLQRLLLPLCFVIRLGFSSPSSSSSSCRLWTREMVPWTIAVFKLRGNSSGPSVLGKYTQRTSDLVLETFQWQRQESLSVSESRPSRRSKNGTMRIVDSLKTDLGNDGKLRSLLLVFFFPMTYSASSSSSSSSLPLIVPSRRRGRKTSPGHS